MTNEQIAIQQHLSKPRPNSGACGCMGPQDNDPMCPCAMNWVEQVNGKWYYIEEHRSSSGITHSAECIGDVTDRRWSCPDDKLQCRNMEVVKLRAYWIDCECKTCGAKVTTERHVR